MALTSVIERELARNPALGERFSGAKLVYLHIQADDTGILEIAIDRGKNAFSSANKSTIDYKLDCPKFMHQGHVAAYLMLVEAVVLQNRYPQLKIVGGHNLRGSNQRQYGDLTKKEFPYSPKTRTPEEKREDLERALAELNRIYA